MRYRIHIEYTEKDNLPLELTGPVRDRPLRNSTYRLFPDFQEQAVLPRLENAGFAKFPLKIDGERPIQNTLQVNFHYFYATQL